MAVKTKIQFKELSVTFEVRRPVLVALQMCCAGLPDELQCTPLDKKEASEIFLLMTRQMRKFSRGLKFDFCNNQFSFILFKYQLCGFGLNS